MKIFLVFASIVWSVTGLIISNASNVNIAEAKQFLDSQTYFETYTIKDQVRCTYGKNGSTWGILFEGQYADGSTFDAVVCSDYFPYTEIPNQPWDPLDVEPNIEFTLVGKLYIADVAE